MSNPQYYLFYSPVLPEGLDPLALVPARENDDLAYEFRQGFEPELRPLGSTVAQAVVRVPEGTVFAGVIYGDGDLFRESHGRSYGVLGEFQRISYDELAVRDVNGQIVAEIDTSFVGITLPAVLPPEAFGLQRHPWWNTDKFWNES
ncbi:MAG: hypothetical protein AAFQ15_04940 [Pseudomonadota bacterium]